MAEGLEQARQRVEDDPLAHVLRDLRQRHDARRGEEQDPQRLAAEDPDVRQPHAEQRRRPRDAERQHHRCADDDRQPQQRGRGRDAVVGHRDREHQEAGGEREALGQHRGRRQQHAVEAAVQQDRLAQRDRVRRAVERQQHDLKRHDRARD
ncbi:MAG: hypothetical protein ACR2LK_05700 [Solirubrobacteraceae bacterium]